MEDPQLSKDTPRERGAPIEARNALFMHSDRSNLKIIRTMSGANDERGVQAQAGKTEEELAVEVRKFMRAGDAPGTASAIAELQKKQEGLYGPESAQVRSTLGQRGGILLNAHRYDDADKCYQQYFALMRKSGNNSTAEEALKLKIVGNLFEKHEQFDKALKYYGESIAVAAKSSKLGPENILVAYDYGCIARIEADQGHWDQAKANYGKAMAIFEKNLPSADLHSTENMISIIDNYISVLQHTGDFKTIATQQKLKESVEAKRDKIIKQRQQMVNRRGIA